MLFDSLSQEDHVWSKDVLEVNGRWEGEVGDYPLVPLTYSDGKLHPFGLLQLPGNVLAMCLTDFCLLLVQNVIRKKLVLDPNMTKVLQALNIPFQFCEWRWLLNEHRKKVCSLPPTKDIER